jgi:hypothetical protein
MSILKMTCGGAIILDESSIEERLHLNPPPIIENFLETLRSDIFVDKTGLLSFLNNVAGTPFKYVCISRPRRFGKTWAANMATAYYSKEFDGKSLFQGLNISKDPSFESHLSKYNVIFLNIQNFFSV